MGRGGGELETIIFFLTVFVMLASIYIIKIYYLFKSKFEKDDIERASRLYEKKDQKNEKE